VLLGQNETTSNTDVWEFRSREYSTSTDAYIVVNYETNTAPTEPTRTSPINSAIVNTLSPTFTGTFNDPDSGDTMSGVQIAVYENNGTTLKWDSGTLSASGTSFSKTYAGPALTGNTFYKWKAKTKDAAGVWGPYNSTLQTFKVNTVPNVPTLALLESPTTDIKTLTPTFKVTHSDPDPGDSLLYGYQIDLQTSGGSSVWNSGEVSSSATTTKSVLYGGSPALSWNTQYRWRAKTKDSNGAWSSYSGYAYFTTHKTGIPINLDPTGYEVVPTDGSGNPAPVFSGARATTADSLTSARVRVYTTGGSLVWDSNTFTSGVTSTGFTKAYGGTTLSYSTNYYWTAQVTSSIGGTSDVSSPQYFTTPAAGAISQTAPVSPVTDTTPDFTFGRSTSFNAYQIEVRRVSDNAAAWVSGTVTLGSTTSTTVTYGATGSAPSITPLAWNTDYKWRVQVSSDSGSSWGSGWTGYVQFSMDSAGIPTHDSPGPDAWLGAPSVIDGWDDIVNVTNGTSASAAVDTADKQTGRASMAVSLTSLSSGSTSETYRTVSLDLSDYGGQTPIKIYTKASTVTNLGYVRLRFTFATSGDYAEYTVTPTTSWGQQTATKGSPVATGGSVDWSNVTRIGVRVNASGGSYSGDINVDDLVFDATNPSFDGTTYNSEVISTYRIYVYDAASGGTLIWDSTNQAGSGTTFSKLYTGSALSPGQTYYWQASYVKSTGPEGGLSARTPFILNSAPTIPTSMSPSTGQVVPDTTAPTFSAVFGDTDKTTRGDVPTGMTVEVYRNSDSTHVYTLYKDDDAAVTDPLIGGTNTVTDGEAGVIKTTGAANPIAYETEYKYRMRFADAHGAEGTWSSYTVFKPSQSPVLTIQTPSESGTVTSPAFNIVWTHTSNGSKGQNSFYLKVVRNSDGVIIYQTLSRVYSSAQTFAFPAGYLVNGTGYTVHVKMWDTDSLTSDPDAAGSFNSFTTNWTAPDAISNFVVSDDVSQSAVSMSWDESTVAANEFRQYTIYRKVTGSDNWTAITDIVNKATTSYLDYTAANSVSYDYKITQFQIIPGDVDLESGDSDISTVTLDTDSWVIIGADRALSHIFEVPVIAAPFQEPVQQEVFEPLGTNRKVILRGGVMGAEGTLQAKWPTSERTIAKEQIDYVKSNAGPHLLKSPFGDVWQVEFAGPTKDYEQVGHFNATLSWTEVD